MSSIPSLEYSLAEKWVLLNWKVFAWEKETSKMFFTRILLAFCAKNLLVCVCSFIVRNSNWTIASRKFSIYIPLNWPTNRPTSPAVACSFLRKWYSVFHFIIIYPFVLWHRLHLLRFRVNFTSIFFKKKSTRVIWWFFFGSVHLFAPHLLWFLWLHWLH